MLITDAFFLLILQMSIVIEQIFSNTAITVENAAKVMNRKKREPQSLPSGIELNMFGRVIKTRLSPLSGLTPKAKHAGKIIRPAVIATNVSSAAMVEDSFIIDVLSLW